MTRITRVMRPFQGFSEVSNGVKDFDMAGLIACALVSIDGFMLRQWCGVFGDCLGFGQQAGLVRLELNKQITVCFTGRQK